MRSIGLVLMVISHRFTFLMGKNTLYAFSDSLIHTLSVKVFAPPCYSSFIRGRVTETLIAKVWDSRLPDGY
jgi:hypothetical protein